MNGRARTASFRGATTERSLRPVLLRLFALALSAFLAARPVLAQDVDVVSQSIGTEICGDGIDNAASGQTEGSCSAGWMNAAYSNGCDLKCSGNDADFDGFPSSGSGLLSSGTAVVNGLQSSVNTITVDAGHTLYRPKWVRISDGGSPTDRQIMYHTDTTITVSGAPVSVIDNLVISAASNPAIDCDDNDKTIYPGVPVQVSGDDYKNCQADGTYTSTITGPIDESGTDDAYYVDCTSGNNANAGTSLAAAFKDIGKVCGGSPGSPPASPVTLTPGDHVYITGACSTTYNDGTNAIFCNITQAGTQAKPIVWEGLPGKRPTLTNSSGIGFEVAATGSYQVFRNLNITTPSAGTGLGITVDDGADNVVIERSIIHDVIGNGDNNNGAVRASGTNGFRVDHSLSWNVERNGATNALNISNIMWLDNNAVGDGKYHYAGFNTLGNDSIDATNAGNLIRFKHGLDAADCTSESMKVVVEGNTLIYPGQNAIMWDGSCLRFRRNYVFGNNSSILYAAPNGEDNGIEDNEITDSTFVNMSRLSINEYDDTLSDGTEFTIKRNLFVDNDSTYTAGNKEGIYSICGGCNDTQKAAAEAETFLVSNENCFHNGATTLNFCYFCNNGGGAGSLGSDYTFAQWLALTVMTPRFDQSSFLENPTLDTSQRATSTNCQNFGVRRLSEAATPTPTPTPEPFGGGGARAKLSRRNE